MWLVLTVFVLLSYPLQSVAGSAYYSKVKEHYTTVSSPPVLLENGTAGSSTIYANSTSAKVSVVAPAPAPTYYPNEYNNLTGTHLSGTIPTSVETVDADYFIVRSSGSATSTLTYNPSDYDLLGGTTLVPGTTGDLISDNAVYMNFSSYDSGTDTLDFVDNDMSNVDYSANKGTHSNFTAQQYGPDSINDTLTEENTKPNSEYVWISGDDDLVRKLNKSDLGGTEILSWGTGTSYPYGCEFRIEDGNEYIYIVDAGANVDALIKFHANNGTEVTRWDISGYSGDAWGLAWNGSRWFISDKNDDLIYQVDPADPTVQERSFTYTGIDIAAGLAWDGSYLWAVDFGNHYVYQMDVYGNVQTSWSSTNLTQPTGIAYDTTSGHLWIVSKQTDYLFEHYINGTLISDWDPSGSTPQGVAYASVEDTYNYELDSEVQWTNVDFTETNEELCIFGGTMDAENITVDSWNGTAWQNLFTELDSGWNNKTVSSYLTSSNFIIRFKGGNETGDTTQDSWNIDVVLLHVRIDQYTSEVEFIGASNTYSLTQLNWTVDLQWTVANVSVTLQLYNSTLGDYPTSGYGYMSYTSDVANSDQTKTQSINVNPTHFRNSTGYWKIKVTGIKNTTIQFDFNADWIEFKSTHYSEYTVSTEFTYSDTTKNTPTQLNFTVVIQYDVSSVNVTIQVWNYSSSSYVTSGEGYANYTSSGSNETTNLSINTNPQFYTSSGNAKIKVTGVLTTTSTYQQETNQVKLVYKYDASSTYDYVLAVTEQEGANWTINLLVYDNASIARLSNTTISFYDGNTSDQIIINGGTITQSEGPPYNLTSSSTTYIKMSNVNATSSGTSYIYVYLKILVPATTTYLLYRIEFEIT